MEANHDLSNGRLSSPALVARDKELAALTEMVLHPPAVVLVEGEAGVGKSRLVTELERGLRQRMSSSALRIGHCHPSTILFRSRRSSRRSTTPPQTWRAFRSERSLAYFGTCCPNLHICFLRLLTFVPGRQATPTRSSVPSERCSRRSDHWC